MISDFIRGNAATSLLRLSSDGESSASFPSSAEAAPELVVANLLGEVHRRLVESAGEGNAFSERLLDQLEGVGMRHGGFVSLGAGHQAHAAKPAAKVGKSATWFRV